MESNATAPASSTNTEARAANKYRFELELEFVQSLANPHYLQALAQQGVMEDPSFIMYLDYLQYWNEPEYAKFIIYPHALHHLQLLQNPRFRADLKADGVLQLLVQKQFDHWRTWRSAPIQSLPTSSLLAQAEAQQQQKTEAGGDTKPSIVGNNNHNGSGQSGGTISRRETPRAGGTPSSAPVAVAAAGGTPRVVGMSTSRPESKPPTPL